MKINKYLDWLIKMLGYAIVLIITSIVFNDTIYIDSSYFGFWGIVTVIILFVLNKTIKPILVWLTLPLTALTLGLFYLIINVVILKLTDLILMSHFNIEGFFMPFFGEKRGGSLFLELVSEMASDNLEVPPSTI